MNEPATLPGIAPSEGNRRAHRGGSSSPDGTSVWDAHPLPGPSGDEHVGAHVVDEITERAGESRPSDGDVAEPEQPRRSARRAEPSRWSVDPRFLAAVVVVGAPAFVVWHIARSDVVTPAAAPPAATAPPSDESEETTTDDADDLAVPALVDGAVVGTWSDDGPLDDPIEHRDTSTGTSGAGQLMIMSATGPNDVDTLTSMAPVQSGSPEPMTAPVGSPASAVVASTSEPVETGTPGDPAAVAEAAAESPQIEIVTRVVACRFSSRCLVAGFTISGFDVRPAEFVCEFASGERYAFPLTAESVDFACATGEADDSITIEVDGVRSETVAHV